MDAGIRIIALSPGSWTSQNLIQPIWLDWCYTNRNLHIEARNVRYALHIESGNSNAWAKQLVKDVTAIHRVATIWPTPTAISICQHDGTEIPPRRVIVWRSSSAEAASRFLNDGRISASSAARVRQVIQRLSSEALRSTMSREGGGPGYRARIEDALP